MVVEESVEDVEGVIGVVGVVEQDQDQDQELGQTLKTFLFSCV